MSTLDRGSFFVIQQFQASGYVRLTRTELAFTRIGEIAHAYDVCRQALSCVELDRYGVLFDWRAPSMATNADLHKAIVQRTDAFAARFARRAILVRTPVGQMQIARVSRQHSDGPPVLFSDEEAALAYVAWGSATAGRDC